MSDNVLRPAGAARRRLRRRRCGARARQRPGRGRSTQPVAAVLIERVGQMKGLGSSLQCSVQSSMASVSWSTEVKVPRRRRLSVSSPNHRSTRFSHDEEVGVKWRWNRVCFASHLATLACL